MKNKYFIGQDYKTIQEKNEILDTYDELQKAKLTFLNDMYNNPNTLKNLWSIYTNHIHKFEKDLNKDLMFFDEIEVDEILANRFRYAQTTKTNIIQFANVYKRWGVDRGDISGNSVEAINRKTATKDMSKVLINRLWGLGKFYNLLVDIERTTELQNTIPMLLARYGISGKQLIDMRALRWNDIDYEKKQVKIIKDGQLIRILEVDDRFIEWIEKYKESSSSSEGTVDYGYVLRKRNKARDSSDMENYNTINSKIYRACEGVEIPRIAFGDLIKSRYIDLLLDIRKDRKLTSGDFVWVVENFKEDNKGMSGATNLKNFYEALTGDSVIMKSTSGGVSKSLKEENSQRTADEIRKKIGFEEFINGEDKYIVDEDGVIIEEIKADNQVND